MLLKVSIPNVAIKGQLRVYSLGNANAGRSSLRRRRRPQSVFSGGFLYDGSRRSRGTSVRHGLRGQATWPCHDAGAHHRRAIRPGWSRGQERSGRRRCLERGTDPELYVESIAYTRNVHRISHMKIVRWQVRSVVWVGFTGCKVSPSLSRLTEGLYCSSRFCGELCECVSSPSRVMCRRSR